MIIGPKNPATNPTRRVPNQPAEASTAACTALRSLCRATAKATIVGTITQNTISNATTHHAATTFKAMGVPSAAATAVMPAHQIAADARRKAAAKAPLDEPRHTP